MSVLDSTPELTASIPYPEKRKLRLASRGRRLVAKLSDGFLVLGACTLVIAANLLARPLLITMISSDLNDIAMTVSIITVVIGFTLCNCFLLSRDGQTIGKRIFGIKIVRSNGKQASLVRLILGRSVPQFLSNFIPSLPLADVLLIFSESRQCLHDHLADTIVVIE